MNEKLRRVTYTKKVDNSIKMQRQCLLAFTTGLEMLNKKFDPFDINLDGWSESMCENINDYDEVFEELYEKYKEKAEVAPELKLMLMVGGSAFMFHITNTMFKSSLPGMEQIIKQNPDIMKTFANAAVQEMGNQNPGVANFMGAYGPQSQQNQIKRYNTEGKMLLMLEHKIIVEKNERQVDWRYIDNLNDFKRLIICLQIVTVI